MNLATHSTEELTYWPSDNKKIPDLLDFGIIKSIPKDFCHTECCLQLFLDFPIIFTINSKIMTKNKPCTLCNTKTGKQAQTWSYFQELLKTTLNNFIPLKTTMMTSLAQLNAPTMLYNNLLECNADQQQFRNLYRIRRSKKK